MRIPPFENVLVLGRGISGAGAEKALEIAGKRVTVCDESDFDDKFSPSFDAVVVSPSVPKSHRVFSAARESGAAVLGELALGFMMCDRPAIAVTGTNGKTTTVELLYRMFARRYDACATGNIGRSFALDATADHDVYIVEASSFQLENFAFSAPHVSIITNITPDHLDRHGTMSEYAAAKLGIAAGQSENDFLVLGADGIPLSLLGGFSTKSDVFYFSARGKVRGAYLTGERIMWLDEEICRVSDIKMRGAHNLQNALAAVAAAKLMGAGSTDIRAALGDFEPDEHRMTYLGSINGVAFYDDSKATNAGACVQAMLSMPAEFSLVAGGSDKGCGFDELFSSGVLPRKMFVSGPTSEKILAAARRAGYGGVVRCNNLKEATLAAYREGADVLLSPAAASFDAFGSYAERGRAFRKIFEEIRSGEIGANCAPHRERNSKPDEKFNSEQRPQRDEKFAIAPNSKQNEQFPREQNSKQDGKSPHEQSDRQDNKLQRRDKLQKRGECEK